MAWFPYTRHAPHRPLLRARLRHGGDATSHILFLVDSGSPFSLVPWSDGLGLGALRDAVPRELPSPLVALLGGSIRGAPLPVIIDAQQLGVFEETVYFCPGLVCAVLGQQGFFERWGVSFHNFADSWRGRRFSVFQPKNR